MYTKEDLKVYHKILFGDVKKFGKV